MPSNSGVPIIASGFFGLAGFALVFSWFWLAAIGGIGILACLIYRSFDYDEGYYISVDEIKNRTYSMRGEMTWRLLDKSLPLEYQSEQSRLNILGFWIFLGAEIMLFATLFASYLVLAGRTADGPTPAQLFELKTLLIQTLLL